MRFVRPESYSVDVALSNRTIQVEYFVGGQEHDWTNERKAQFEEIEARVLAASAKKHEADAEFELAKQEWLEFHGDDVGAVEDKAQNVRIVTFINKPKTDKDALYQAIYPAAPDIWRRNVNQELVMQLRFRYDARRSIDKLVLAMNQHASLYNGYVDPASLDNETIVNVDGMQFDCKRRDVPFPWGAFNQTFGLRVYPKSEPQPTSDPSENN